MELYNTLFNSLSHELRTPIAAIIGATDNLLMKPNKLTKENKLDLIAEISVASLRLNQQVSNLLNMSQLESGGIHPKKDWCDINELLYKTTGPLEENNRQHTIIITVQHNLPLFFVDRNLLGQALYHLVQNAILYTPENTCVTLKANCADGKCIITVEDEGRGFPQAEINKVFDKFYRLKDSVTGGTGLGLSIAKGFIEVQGGTITVENNHTGGATFTITINAASSCLNVLSNE